MIRKFYLLAAICMLPLMACAQNAMFQKYASMQDIKYVCISHTMLQSMSSQKNVKLGNMSLSDMVDYIDNVVIISAKEPSSMVSVMSDQKFLEDNPQYETLLVKNINGQRSMSYFCQGKDASEFVLFSYSDVYTVVVITGHFSPQQFQSFFL